MAPDVDTHPPADDAGYLERLSQAIFMAGLNWKMVENKWPNFVRAFSKFSPGKVATLSEREVHALMSDAGIIRNEKKIRSTVDNAAAVLKLRQEFGSMSKYIESFEKDESGLQRDLQLRFKHVGPSTARTFLWMVGYRLTPTKEERAWLKAHHR